MSMEAKETGGGFPDSHCTTDEPVKDSTPKAESVEPPKDTKK